MLPDQGCYEERYGLTGPAALFLALSLVPVVPAIFSHQPLPWLVLSLALFALVTLPSVIALGSRMIAFRADPAGITLGADPVGWPVRRVPAVFVPWADVERIILYRGPESRFSIRDVPCIGIQRRQGAPALSWGSKPAPGCPVRGVAAGATRPITAWRLDRDRLAALTAAVAPGILIVDASTAPNPSVEGPSQRGSVPGPGPAA
jgi:hypothetical protein